MAQPFVGEIRVFGGNFAPSGWALCNGQTIAIDQNTALFSLIGTTYGGDGVTTFNLPDLQGRCLMHQGTARSGTTYVEGQPGGLATVTLTQGQMPSHNHNLLGSNVAGTSAIPGPAVALAATPTGEPIYDNTAANQVNLANQAVSSAPGGSQPHDNRQPYLAVTYIISLFGIFPSRN
jgi:microcystin-dependent protein